MCGDNAEADIGGGAACGIQTSWLAGGRSWPKTLPFRPNHICQTAAQAIDHVLGLAASPDS